MYSLHVFVPILSVGRHDDAHSALHMIIPRAQNMPRGFASQSGREPRIFSVVPPWIVRSMRQYGVSVPRSLNHRKQNRSSEDVGKVNILPDSNWRIDKNFPSSFHLYSARAHVGFQY